MCRPRAIDRSCLLSNASSKGGNREIPHFTEQLRAILHIDRSQRTGIKGVKPDWRHSVECDGVRPVTRRSGYAGCRDRQVDGVLYIVMVNTIVTKCQTMKPKDRREATWLA